ncbi:MAG TPA: DegT/DnrJ/EryC1/StrS family aminotransferase [Gemmatimonadales bacterium]|nr:DegT/DnrJ/EryC1/StrS family aminotransferase [Gemmatimonadales bacterium]
MSNVPFTDLRAMHDEVRADIERGWSRLIDTSAFVGGAVVADFEAAFARFCGTAQCVGVGSGTDAVRIALQAVGVGRGDLVITVPHTFIATVEGITQAGADPVFVDVDDVTYNMAPALVERYLEQDCQEQGGQLVERRSGRRVAALLPVHLYGQAADMDPLVALARRFGLRIVEDAAQAHGATYKGKRCGSLGDAAAFSFYPGKNLGAMGEAGAVTTQDPAVAERCRVLREHGQSERYIHVTGDGSNARLDAVQAVALSAKLPRLEQWTDQRRRVAAWYAERLADLDLVLPHEGAGREHVYHLYVVQAPDRDAVRRHLEEQKVGSGLHYPVPLHRQQAYAELGYEAGAFPVSERVAARCLSLPMFPHMTESQADSVAEALRAAVGAVVGR